MDVAHTQPMMWQKSMYAWMCCVAALVAVPEAAYACVYGTDFEIDEVRANGLVALSWICKSRRCTDEDVPDPLRIVNAATMAEVPGTVVWSIGEDTSFVNVFWRATDPLVAGRTYRVLDLQPYADGRNEFTVLPEVTWVKPAELELRADLDVLESHTDGDISCRARWKPRPCSPDEEPYPDDIKLTTVIQKSLTISAYPTHPTGQVPPMKRRAVFWRDGDAPDDLNSKPWSLSPDSRNFKEQASRYCYRAAVQNLLDGSEHVWEGCLDHGDLPVLASRAVSREQLEAEAVRCTEPPAGLEKAWCEQSMVVCQRSYSRPEPSDCENVMNVCAAVAESDGGVDDEDAGAESPDAGKPRKPSKPRIRPAADSGCSLAAQSSETPAPFWLLTLTTAVAALWRRKRA